MDLLVSECAWRSALHFLQHHWPGGDEELRYMLESILHFEFVKQS